jgi:hypothetical protein
MSALTHILGVVGPSIILGRIVGLLCRKHVLLGVVLTVVVAIGYFVFLGFKEGTFSAQWPLAWNVLEMLEQAAAFAFLFLIPSVLGFAVAQRLLAHKLNASH